MIRLNKVSKTYRNDKEETLAVKDSAPDEKTVDIFAMIVPHVCG